MANEQRENISPEQEAATLDSVVAREIVQEILKFGVTQDQILKIVEILAMELEDRDTMVSLVECVNRDYRKENHNTSGLITDI